MDNANTSRHPIKAFVCGWPIEQSKSPLIHNHWLCEFGIEGSYEKIAVAPEGFAEFLTSLRDKGYAGGNITIPHKQDAMQLVDKLEENAAVIGAVNTVWFEGDQLIGGNTDWLGFSANLEQHLPGWSMPQKSKSGKTAIVLGAGGAARAILYALVNAGFTSIILANRTLETAEKLAAQFQPNVTTTTLANVVEAFSSADILVNTSSMGMQNAPEFPPHILENVCRMKTGSLVTDIVYAPLETPLLAAAKSAGLKTVDGLGMLLHQAVPGFEKWFGVRPVVDETLRQIVLSGSHKSGGK